ncbi:MAG: hypothetical protein HLUCCA09_00055 [Rhodobacteraceae bacterium HLUCCA09]|nr:MAG: hypothetical protein HLUCCA09_00055 [Rhodobacteraceae bacterium HLUCCA09]
MITARLITLSGSSSRSASARLAASRRAAGDSFTTASW